MRAKKGHEAHAAAEDGTERKQTAHKAEGEADRRVGKRKKSADAEKTKKGERGMAADRVSKGERKQDAARFETAGGREALGCKKNDGRRWKQE